MSPRILVAPALMFTLLQACSSTSTSGSDSADGGKAGGELDAGVATPDVDAAPANNNADASMQALQFPQLTPCADGWREFPVDGFTACDPWPDTGMEDCTGANLHVPGTAGCEAIGSTCPASGWDPNIPAGASVLYVDLSASGQQNGSQQNPYRTLAAALTAAIDGQIIALAAGDYVENIRVRDDVTIWGACAEATRLVSAAAPVTEADRDTLASIESASVGFHNLSIVGGFPAFALTPSTGLDLDAVVIEQSIIGVELASQSQLTTNDVAFRRLRVVSPDDPICGSIAARCAGLHGSAVSSAGPNSLDASVSLVRTAVGPGASIKMNDGVSVSTTTLDLDRFVGISSVSHTRGITNVVRSDLESLQGDHIAVQDSVVDRITAVRSSVLDRALIHTVSLLGEPGDQGHTLRDVIVSEALSSESIAFITNSLRITNDTNLSRVALIDGEDVALRIEGQASVMAEDLHIARVGTSNDSQLPVAVGLYENATMSLQRFSMASSELVGAQLMDQALLDLHDGDIASCVIGVNVQIADYDISTLQDRVRYSDNQVDIDAQNLAPPPPLPEWQCDDGIDNDGDNNIDCDDDSCAGFSGCAL